jgi:hypothetical protein
VVEENRQVDLLAQHTQNRRIGVRGRAGELRVGGGMGRSLTKEFEF